MLILIELLATLRMCFRDYLPILVLIVSAYLVFRLKAMPFRHIGYSFHQAFRRKDPYAQGEITPLQSMMAGQALTMGTGCITGSAAALMHGGFGSIFWILLIGLLCMVLKFAEGLLSIKYRCINERGEICGGPMYYLSHAFSKKWLGISFAFFGTMTALLFGAFILTNCIVVDVEGLAHLPSGLTGSILSLILIAALVGGIKPIAKISTILVTALILIYAAASLIILGSHLDKIPYAFYAIFSSAFSGKALSGGLFGILVASMQYAVHWNLASQQLGLGTMSIMTARAKIDMPARQALISLSGFLFCIGLTFITALVIFVTGAFDSRLSLTSEQCVMNAFHSVYPFGDRFILCVILLINLPALVSWAYFGEKCIQFLGGENVIRGFRVLFCLSIIFACFLNIQQFSFLAGLASIMISLMAITHLIGLMRLSSVISIETRTFFDVVEKEKRQRKSAELASD